MNIAAMRSGRLDRGEILPRDPLLSGESFHRTAQLISRCVIPTGMMGRGLDSRTIGAMTSPACSCRLDTTMNGTMEPARMQSAPSVNWIFPLDRYFELSRSAAVRFSDNAVAVDIYDKTYCITYTVRSKSNVYPA